ncbi:Uncharacterised protein [uncultured archaeon]|nr:Uncharacterised protein [uncultured archaeon]
MPQEYKVYLDDILESIEKIESYTCDMSYEEFRKTPVVIDAVLRNLEIIGEAVKRLPSDMKRKYSRVEWKKIAGLRDILIHEYSGINLTIVWDIVINKIPEFKESIRQISSEIEIK